jgi:hypothetical protein
VGPNYLAGRSGLRIIQARELFGRSVVHNVEDGPVGPQTRGYVMVAKPLGLDRDLLCLAHLCSGPHSGEGLSTAERVKSGGASCYEGTVRLQKNSVYRISRPILA